MQIELYINPSLEVWYGQYEEEGWEHEEDEKTIRRARQTNKTPYAVNLNQKNATRG